MPAPLEMPLLTKFVTQLGGVVMLDKDGHISSAARVIPTHPESEIQNYNEL
jgi:hypothetical protein